MSDTPLSDRRLAIVLAYATAAVLIAMVIVGMTTGATQEPHEHFAAPDAYAKSLLDQAGPLRVMFFEAGSPTARARLRLADASRRDLSDPLRERAFGASARVRALATNTTSLRHDPEIAL